MKQTVKQTQPDGSKKTVMCTLFSLAAADGVSPSTAEIELPFPTARSLLAQKIKTALAEENIPLEKYWQCVAENRGVVEWGLRAARAWAANEALFSKAKKPRSV